MMVVTTEEIAGKRIVRTLGLVRGNSIRARHIGSAGREVTVTPPRRELAD